MSAGSPFLPIEFSDNAKTISITELSQNTIGQINLLLQDKHNITQCVAKPNLNYLGEIYNIGVDNRNLAGLFSLFLLILAVYVYQRAGWYLKIRSLLSN